MSLGEKLDNCGKTLHSLIPGEQSRTDKSRLEGLSGPLNISCNAECESGNNADGASAVTSISGKELIHVFSREEEEEECVFIPAA